MLRKDCLFFGGTELGGYDQKIEGSITAGSDGSSPQIGYQSGYFGSCTSSLILNLYDCDGYNAENRNVEGLRIELKQNIEGVFCLSERFHIVINGEFHRSGYIVCYPTINASTSEFFTSYWVSADAPRFLLYVKNEKLDDSLSSTVKYVRACNYPVICNPDEWSNAKSQYDGANLRLSTEKVEVGYRYGLLESGHTVDVPIVGFESGKTYDFTLEYKIDAIITEDGVQTF